MELAQVVRRLMARRGPDPALLPCLGEAAAAQREQMVEEVQEVPRLGSERRSRAPGGSLERGLLLSRFGSQFRRRKTKLDRSTIRSLPDAGSLLGLTSQLDEAMENMIKMGGIGQTREEEEDDEDDEDEDDDDDETDDEDDEEEVAGPVSRLARDYEAAVAAAVEAAVAEALMAGPEERGEALRAAREGLWLLRQGACGAWHAAPPAQASRAT
jgi:hypothetical protein